MIESSRPFLFFDYFRVPYTVAKLDVRLSDQHPLRACGELRHTGDDGRTRSLYWLPADAQSLRQCPYRLGSIRIFARVLTDDVAARWLESRDDGWRRTDPVFDGDGARVASVWRSANGDVFVPFDPDEVIESFWSERYKSVGASSLSTTLKGSALRAYYRLRPLIPRDLQIRLRRVLSRFQARSTFPAWPVETALHDVYRFLFGLVGGLTGEPVPSIAPWPRDHTWALVLTHDVETRVGYDHLDLLRNLELAQGFRSSWNFVARRYPVEDEVVRALAAGGFEVGVHGLYHDGRDVDPSTLRDRLPAMQEYGARWDAQGFRSPATRRNWSLMSRLGFDYDSSYPDTDPFEPDAGGCCTWLPYFNEDVVELPITLPQDHTLFRILRQTDETAWIEKATYLRDHGGMALMITHPDYMLAESRLEAYGRFLRTFADDTTAWRALPREVSAWWRRRAESRLELVEGEWQVVGPAAGEARVVTSGSNGRAMVSTT